MEEEELVHLRSMDSDKAKAKLSAVAEELGKEIRVFTNPAASAESNEATAISTSEPDEPDDFYEFTPADYYRVIANKMGDQFLKTRKFREAEAAKRRARITKAVIRVRFPDNYTLEVKFQPSETIQCLVDLLRKVLARPDLPFYLYTTPPKERIKDMLKDFYSAGFAPGAIVYFSYDLPKGPFLRDEILSLNGLDLVPEQSEVTHSAPEPVVVEPPPPVQETKAEGKKPVKPKWLKL
ncbi:hypothetical protein QJS04_geneDACA014062 [Acorus gramineus]|uniref:UBX domain-containing protein n=1 Tax=Acorus gramineus TaxID=55184 RepID=A0AAV9B1Q9_ACOGR|nr:hypothetical protein QJS04_geneDACA014062 [Acorus gramineus]